MYVNVFSHGHLSLTCYYLIEHSLFARFVPTDLIEEKDFYTQRYSSPFEAKELLNELKKEGIDRLSGEKQILAVLKWTMDQSSTIGDAASLSVPELLRYARSYGSMECNDMGLLFSEALTVVDIPARRIILARNIFDRYDVHSTVEAWFDGKWRIYDPTFNISPTYRGEVIGAFEARKVFLQGDGEIAFRFYGNVKYPARLEIYYMSYRPLFNNVFVVVNEDRSFLRFFPLISYFRGDFFAYPDDKSGLSITPIVVYNDLHFLMVIVLPLSLLALVIIFVFYRIRGIEPYRDNQ